MDHAILGTGTLKKCSKCSMLGMKKGKEIILKGSKRYVRYKCIYCGYTTQKEI